MSRADRVLRDVFDASGEARSPEYRAGVLALLSYRLDDGPLPKCPYIAGTAQADAWFSGTEEGHRLARNFLETII